MDSAGETGTRPTQSKDCGQDAAEEPGKPLEVPENERSAHTQKLSQFPAGLYSAPVESSDRTHQLDEARRPAEEIALRVKIRFGLPPCGIFSEHATVLLHLIFISE